MPKLKFVEDAYLTVPPTLQPFVQVLMSIIVNSIVLPISIGLFAWDSAKQLIEKGCYPEPRVILITGASSGIGKAFAKEYAKPGVTLGLLARNKEALQEVAEECEFKGAECHVIKADIQNHDSLRKILEDFDDKYPVDLLFSNAGTLGEINPSDSKWADSWKNTFDTNLGGNVATVMPIFERMKQRKRGQICVNSSIYGYFNPPIMIWYGATKSALNSFTLDLNYFASKHNVRVNLLAPGFISTNLTGNNPHLPSPANFAKVIRVQLENNVFYITYPFYQGLVVYILSSLPKRIALLATNLCAEIY